MIIAILVLTCFIFLFDALGFYLICWLANSDREDRKEKRIAELQKLKSDDIIMYINHSELKKAHEVIAQEKQVL